MTASRVDVAILGGGVAGLWIRAALEYAGYSTALFSVGGLGAGQTVLSQGILHRGVKYTAMQSLAALAGVISRAERKAADPLASRLGEAITAWEQALGGQGPADLRSVRVLSPTNVLWAFSAAHKLKLSLAGRLLASDNQRLARGAYPPAFAGAPSGITLVEVNEVCLDTQSLCVHLARSGTGQIWYPSTPEDVKIECRSADGSGKKDVLIEVHRSQRLVASAAIFASGAGNQTLLQSVGEEPARWCQRRPLHMLYAIGAPHPLFGHCFEGRSDDKPRLTITTSRSGSKLVWYIGGWIAEEGVNREAQAQIERGKHELRECLAWLSLDGLQWGTLNIDRAEGLEDVPEEATPRSSPSRPASARPGREVLRRVRDLPLFAAWPTKLALAPLLAQRVVEGIREIGVGPSGTPITSTSARTPRQMSATPSDAGFPPDIRVAAPPWGELRQSRNSPSGQGHVGVVPHRWLGATGLRTGVLGLGTVKLGRTAGLKYPQAFELPSDDDVVALLDAASNVGINLIDTAPAYGESEERLGRLLGGPMRGQRDQWILCTKAGEEFDGERSRFDFRPEALRASVERSLRRLRTDVLDVALLHSDGVAELSFDSSGAFDAMKQLRSEGKLRAWGASTKTIEGGLLASTHADVLMLTLSPRQREQIAVIEHARTRGVGVMIKKALDSGWISSPDEVEQAFALCLRQPGVACIVVGTRSASRLEENAEIVRRALLPRP
ncbi:MAG: aldo/keto reductase [Planctomycetota bacterium]|nr:aldo/keto reductase [Planctomycetota bacterium]